MARALVMDEASAFPASAASEKRPTLCRKFPIFDCPGLRSRSSVIFDCPGLRGKLDWLGRSLSHLLAIVTSLKGSQVAFRSLTEGMDTTTASGELLLHVFGALAQYERALIQERVVAGLAAAKRRGRIGGRPPAIVGGKRDAVLAVLAALDSGLSKAAVCRNSGVKRTTLIETLARVGWTVLQELASIS